jgi:DNA-binding transcriptional LysR family regulator
MYERTYAPGFHDLIFGMLNDAAVVPNVCQSDGQMPTLISLVDSGMGISILPASAVKHSGASVAVCDIKDTIPMSEIGIAVNRGNRAAIIENFMSFTLEMLNRTRGRSVRKGRRQQVQM